MASEDNNLLKRLLGDPRIEEGVKIIATKQSRDRVKFELLTYLSEQRQGLMDLSNPNCGNQEFDRMVGEALRALEQDDLAPAIRIVFLGIKQDASRIEKKVKSVIERIDLLEKGLTYL